MKGTQVRNEGVMVKSRDTTDLNRRTRVSQVDVPRHTLEDALRIPRALADAYAKQPAKPLRVAEAINMSPTSGPFRSLCGAAIAYGLTEGGYNAEQIALTELGRRVVSPTEEGDDVRAQKAAFLHPQIVNRFLTKYNGSKLPPDQIAKNVLEEMGVPKEATDRTFQLIVGGAKKLGLLVDIKGASHVDLDTVSRMAAASDVVDEEKTEVAASHVADTDRAANEKEFSLASGRSVNDQNGLVVANNKMFITHGRNKGIVEQLKELVAYGGFEPHVEVEKEGGAVSLPDKVMNGMKSCSTAVIHVGVEEKLFSPEGGERQILNSNVLIEIGAAMALYGKRFILLVEKGAELPTNLQGLYQVRFEGERLDYEGTMKLLKSLNEIKKTA